MQFITPDMEHVFKLWTILFVVTIYSCNSENSSEISTGIEQREKVSDTGSNNNAIVIPKELDSVRETEMDNSVLSADTVTSEKIMIALTGMYRKGDKEHLISGDGKQWYGVFTNVDGPPKYKIIPTILHIKDTVDEGDITYDEYEKTPNSIIISADNNKDNWNNCLFLFKGIKTAAKQEKNYPHFASELSKMFPGEVIYGVSISSTDHFDLYAEGIVILDSSEAPRNQSCNDGYSSGDGVVIKNYSIFLINDVYHADIDRWTVGKKYVLLPSSNICNNAIPTIKFIGDLDGDEIPDFLLQYRHKMAWSIVLLLSSKGFKEVAEFYEGTGC